MTTKLKLLCILISEDYRVPCPKCRYQLAPDAADPKDMSCLMCGKVVYHNPHDLNVGEAADRKYDDPSKYQKYLEKNRAYYRKRRLRLKAEAQG
jgi:hypothetical protein